jgi:hypothetical protein
MLRILRGLGSRSLECGCFVGVYETYAGATVEVVEERDPRCAERSHEDGRVILPVDGDNNSIHPPARAGHTAILSSGCRMTSERWRGPS